MMNRSMTVMVLALATLILAGCGGGDTTATQDIPETTPEAAAPSPAPEVAETAPSAEKVGPNKVTIYRDTWGIPHIYADTPADAAFGIGYAQAEDRLEDIYKNVRMATGTYAEAFGPDYVEQDYLMRLFKNGELMEQWWPNAPEHLRELGDNFMRGVEAYVAEHPERKPEFATELHGWHCASIGRAMILNWPVGTIMDDLKNRHEEPPRGSNQWAVLPSRSADGSAILITDPHLTWEGMAVFHEARVHGGDLQMNGFFIVGSPLVALGHNDQVGWACTTGGPDTSDVYELTLNPQNPMEYKYDDEWKRFEETSFTIRVKDGDTLERPALYSVHGPLMELPDFQNHKAYAGATPYLDETDLFEQMYRMVTAKNCEDFYQALGMNQYMEQNVMFADRMGNVYYVRTGRTPIRPEGYEWDRPVPGDTSKTRWLGIHPIEDLVQIKNPEQGYMQNCNISPGFMTQNCPMQPVQYKPYIFNVSWDKMNPRGQRALQLLASDDSVDREEAMAYAMDIYDIKAQPWKNALKSAVEALGSERLHDEDLAEAVAIIDAWDGTYAVESIAAPIVKVWREKCAGVVDAKAIENGEPLDEARQTALLDALAQALTEMKAVYGDKTVMWGDTNVVGRGGRYFPSPGADYLTSETLLDVSGGRELPDRKGTYLCRSGSMSIMLMFFRPEGIESHSCQVWGNSADPESPHYLDQAEKLYTQRKFKPTWWTKAELQDNVESQKTLDTTWTQN